MPLTPEAIDERAYYGNGGDQRIVTARLTAADAQLGAIQCRALARGCPSPDAAALLVRLAESMEIAS